MLKKLYARFILWLIEPALELDLKSFQPKKLSNPTLEVENFPKPKSKKVKKPILDLKDEKYLTPQSQLDLLEIVKELKPEPKSTSKYISLPLNDRLRLVREYRGFSQEQLGRYTGFDQSQISAYERGKKKFKLKDILEFSKALGISTDYFLGRVNDFRDKKGR
jgi:ribosome-binding protein aMBF1 (putative translation factor)